MKAFTLTIIGLALTSFCVVQLMHERDSRDKTYAEELSEIAKFVNSNPKATWKASQYLRWSHITKTQAEKLQGALDEVSEDRDLNSRLPKAFPESEPGSLPDSFDSRSQWPLCASIGTIRDQSACGSCWAYGAAEAISDRICIHSNQTDQTLISAEDILSCCYNCGNGCDGGYTQKAWEYYTNQGAPSGGLYGDQASCKPASMPPCAHHAQSSKYPPCPQNYYPTPGCKYSCEPGYPVKYSKDLRFGSRSYGVKGEDNFKAEIVAFGPIEAVFTVYQDFFTYKSGVYSHLTGSKVGGHAIKIIGYGTEGGVNYWICANSWNESWGENGFFKIKRGDNECGIESGGYAGTPQ